MFRPELRAALITVLLVAHGIAAAPIPHVVTKEDLQNPVAEEEVALWAGRLSSLGYTIDADQLSTRVREVTGVVGRAHRWAIAPFRPLFRWTGTGQGWALFANPDIYPSRLSIQIRRQGATAFELLYLRLDPEHDWASDLLSYRRVRGVYDAGGFRGKPRAPYRRFAEWIGRRILDADPSVAEVEVRMIRTHTTLRGQPPDDAIEVRHVTPIRRPR